VTFKGYKAAYSYYYALGDQEKYSVIIPKAIELKPDLRNKGLWRRRADRQKR